RGDLAAAADVAAAGVKLVWFQMTDYLTRQWVAFKNVVVDTWRDVSNILTDAIAGYVALGIAADEGWEAGRKFLDTLDEDKKREQAAAAAAGERQLAEARAEVDRSKAALQSALDREAEAAALARLTKS